MSTFVYVAGQLWPNLAASALCAVAGFGWAHRHARRRHAEVLERLNTISDETSRLKSGQVGQR